MHTQKLVMSRGILAILTSIFLSALSGCGTTGTDGFVQIGPDTYMLGRLGGFMDYSGSAVKARLFKEAGEFCKAKGRVMVPITSTARDGGMGEYASAEIQFLCLPPSDPRAQSVQAKIGPVKE